MLRITARNPTDGKREGRRAALATADRRGLHRVDAGRQIVLNARVKTRSAIVAVRDAAAIFSHKIQIGITIS